jgi:hypothetical protein
MDAERLSSVPALVQRLYDVVDELSDLFPGRPFTPDGHLVGSLGEVIAAYLFDLTLEPPSTEGFDARTSDGRTVEVKLTQGKRVLLSDLDLVPDLLVVLYLARNQPVSVIFSGPAERAWVAAGKPSKRAVRSIGTSTLRRLQGELPVDLVLHPVRELPIGDAPEPVAE